MQFQLRSYRIADGELDRFVAEWRTLVLPLRKKLGFSVVGPWVSREQNRFVWLVGYDGDIKTADERYIASEERRSMQPDPARLVVESDKLWLEAPT